jgi:hypothetical protein
MREKVEVTFHPAAGRTAHVAILLSVQIKQGNQLRPSGDRLSRLYGKYENSRVLIKNL